MSRQVLDQFLSTSIDECSELTESYLIGNRLIKFLSTVLPTHKDYFNPNCAAARSNSQGQLVQLLQYMEQLALIIDEGELNRCILSDLSQVTDGSPVPPSNKTAPPQTPPPPSGRRKSATTVAVDNPVTVESPLATSPVVAPEQSSRSRKTNSAALDLVPLYDVSFDESRDLSLDLSGEFDNLVGSQEREEYTPEWDAQFSQEFDVHHSNKSGDQGRNDDFGFAREPSKNGRQKVKPANEAGWSPRIEKHTESLSQQKLNAASRSPSGKQTGVTAPQVKVARSHPQKGKQTGSTSPQGNAARSTAPPGKQGGSMAPLRKQTGSSLQKPAGSTPPQAKGVAPFPQQAKQSPFSMEWSTNFHNEDPFLSVGKKNQGKASRSAPADATRKDDEWKPDFALATPIKLKKKVTFASAETSVSNSQVTPPQANAPPNRKSSPTSVLEFHEWQSCDDDDAMRHVIQVHKPSDECSSLGSHDEPVHNFRILRRKPNNRNLFKGCVKCFLD